MFVSMVWQGGATSKYDVLASFLIYILPSSGNLRKIVGKIYNFHFKLTENFKI